MTQSPLSISVPFAISLSIASGIGLLLPAPAAAQQSCVFPIDPGPMARTQPDGAAIRLRARGDAFRHWYEDEQGYPVVEAAGAFVYARLAPDGGLAATGARVGSADPAALGLALGLARGVTPRRASGLVRPPAPAGAKTSSSILPLPPGGGGGQTAAPYASNVRNLVLVLRFSNHGPSGQNRTLPSNADVTTIMNAVGGHPTLAPTGSVRDHYLEGSYGQFTIDSTVVGWLDLPNTETYYANGNSGLTDRTWEVITSGLAQADATVDFTQFDVDADGWIDAITVLHSGYGAEFLGVDQYGTDYVDRMWSHKWSIPTWTSAEGVKVSDYNISPGLWSTSGSNPGRIGVVCHELGHFFGMPDLYDTGGVGDASQGIGNWCLMAAGSWGFDGSQRHPTHMSAWAKMKLGWLEPIVALPGALSIPRVETSPSVLRIDSGYPPGEYLLVENKNQTGFDNVIPQNGLAVWHVDEAKGSYWGNDPNNDEGYPGQSGWPANNRHYRIALLQADGGFDMEHNSDRGDAGDVYHGAGTNNLSDSTTPNTKAYQGGTIVSNLNRLQSISNAGATMTASFTNTGAPVITTAALPGASVGTAYTATLASSGGTNPKTWSEYVLAPSYPITDLGAQTFALGGTAQNWRADENQWLLTLPFAFPYFERNYTKVYVSSNGFVDVNPGDPEFENRLDWLRFSTRIAPLWDDLRTDVPGGDVFVDTSVAGQVRIRWAAQTFSGGAACNFAVVLFSDGRIRFEYGNGNTGLTPNVGVSRGVNNASAIPGSHNAQGALTNAHALLFTRQGSQIPPGMSLSSAGVLSGTPTAAGTYALRPRVTDNLFRYDQKLLTLVVGVGADCNGNGVPDATDISNGTSSDCDGNLVPDECQPNADGDSLPDACDGCPLDPLKIAPGVCGCGIADTDSDGDGTPNCIDQCPLDPLKIVPGLCGCGVAETDSDGDGTPNCIDGCPLDPLKIAPGVCGCGVADTDTDGDGTPNCIDQCPTDPLKIVPGLCGCGAAETDSDGDGTPNCIDQCPTDPLKIVPGLCGCGVAETDSDGDGTPNCIDGCPLDPLKIAPGLCGCGVADTDTDGDGTPNCIDQCPTDPLKIVPGLCGCGVAETDSDGDGTPNCIDGCPLDPLKIAPGACGCGIADADTDGDGTPDCHDQCPTDPFKIVPGLCGCGVPETDSDSDGTPDCNDGCPLDPLKIAPGVCGCGTPDTDSDGDGVYDCDGDKCPYDPLKVSPGICGCGVPDTDTDGDGIADCLDNCPALPNPSQADCNTNGIGDVCDIASGTSTDIDSNGVPDECTGAVLAFCFGDGSGTACPCGNAGIAGHGCANSVNAQGARLEGSGSPRVSADTFVLDGTGMPNSSALYFQGTLTAGGGAGTVFGDGLRCVAGSVLRLGTKINAAGASSYPGPGDQPISIRGAIPAGGGTRHYQVWYRNAAVFCTTSTFNLSNGLTAVWAP